MSNQKKTQEGTGSNMFVEERIYTLRPGRTGDFLKLYEEEALAIQLKHLRTMIGYYSSEFGPLNQIIHLWAFDDINRRVERRDRMMADPDWRHFVNKLLPLIEHQESRILRPAPFFRSKLAAIVQQID
ncbi:NIPSNAP family protein [Paraburkholderia phytofirmans]|nr:NIPSNAP family protein [Paraburkholderia phytofirmans]